MNDLLNPFPTAYLIYETSQVLVLRPHVSYARHDVEFLNVDFSATVYCRAVKLKLMVYQYPTVIPLAWSPAVFPIIPKN